MAERGAPIGNQNARKAKTWEGAIRRVLAENDGEKLRAMAEKIVNEALAGNVSALKEVGDRLDGKAAQSLTLAGDSESPLRLIIQQ